MYYNKIDVSEGIDVNKANESKKCDICHYWYFLGNGFRFQTYVCNGYYDLLVMSTNFDDIAILKINGVDYCWKADLTEKSGKLLNITFY